MSSFTRSLYGIFILLLLYNAPPLQGQNVKGGLVAGVNFTQVEGDNVHGFYNIGVNAGGMAAVPLSSKFTLSLELLYTQKGATTLEVDAIGFAESYDLSIDYIEIPALINYHDKKRVNFGAGLAMGSLIQAKETVPNHSFQEDYPYNSLDYNVVINGNYLITPKIGINIRWAYSIMPIRDNPPQFNKTTQHNHLVSLRALYYFMPMFSEESDQNIKL